MGLCFAASIALLRLPSPSGVYHCLKNKQRKMRRLIGSARAKLHRDTDNDPFLESAIHAASLRFQETRRPSPLFLDPYAGCLIPPFTDKDMKQYQPSTTAPCHYCIATKFIDDKLLNTLNRMDGPRQIVLLTDGMDTRPYRLNWPQSTIIFDISPGWIFKIASERLGGIGAKISRTCLLLHVPLETSDIHRILHRKGFNGRRSSIWVFQGLPVMKLSIFKEILFAVSSSAAKGCIFVGELPTRLAELEFGAKIEMQEWMDQLFMSNGFQVNMIDYDEVAKTMNLDPPSGDYGNMLFVAKQLQLSDDQVIHIFPSVNLERMNHRYDRRKWKKHITALQSESEKCRPRKWTLLKAFVMHCTHVSPQMENWRREFQRIEEEGDEEGFEEL